MIKNNLRFTFFIFLVFRCVNLTHCQSVFCTHLNQKNGLPDIEFYDILEDRNGYVWLASDSGLYRYDGTEYKYFSHPFKKGLSVFNLKLDDSGKLWCNNISGQFFYVDKEELKIALDISDKIKQQQLPYFEIFNKNELYVSSDKGLLVYDLKYKTLKKKLLRAHKEKHSIIRGTDSNRAFYVSDSLYKIENKEVKSILKNNGLYSEIFTYKQQQYFVSNLQNEVFKDSNIYLYRIGFNSSDSQKIELPNVINRKAIIYAREIDNYLWICTNGGLYKASISDNNLIIHNSYFADDWITRVLKDRNGNFWVCTLKKGIFLIPNFNLSAINLEGEKITAIHKKGNTLICGTNSGKLFEYKVDKEFFVPLKGNNYKAGKVSKIKKYKEKGSLLLLKGANLYSYDNLNLDLSFKSFPGGIKEFSYIDDEQFIITGNTGTYISDWSEGKNGVANHLLLDTVRGYKTLTFSKDQLYFSSSNGLFKATKIGTKFNIDKINSSKQKRNVLFPSDILKYRDSTIIIATYDRGIFLSTGERLVNLINKEKGLYSNSVTKMMFDNTTLWIASSNGIQSYNLETHTLKNHFLNEDIGLSKVIDIKVFDKYVFFLTEESLLRLDKKNANRNNTIPNIYIKAVKVLDKNVPFSEKLELPYNNNSFSVDFVSPSFSSKYNITYHYRIKGLEERWNITKGNTINYPLLPSGEFIFEIKAQSSKTNLFSHVKTIPLKIRYPFWKKTWFYIMLGTFLVLVFFLTIRYLKRKQKEEVLKEKIEKDLILTKLENLRSQMDPHFIFNSLNSIQSYIITNKKNKASKFLAEFSDLIRSYLIFNSEEEISLSEEVKLLNLYLDLEKARIGEDFSFKITENVSQSSELVKIPTFFIQPFVENAIKHGLMHKDGKKELLLQFNYDQISNVLDCLVTDNGIGRDKANEIKQKKKLKYPSYSTKANSDRMQLLNKTRKRKVTVEIKDMFNPQGEAIGTQVQIQIPQTL